jgi:hypothetical protein
MIEVLHPGAWPPSANSTHQLWLPAIPKIMITASAQTLHTPASVLLRANFARTVQAIVPHLPQQLWSRLATDAAHEPQPLGPPKVPENCQATAN